MIARLSRRTLLPVFLAASVGGAAAAPVQVDPAFGYRIGDKVVATGEIAVDERAQLDVGTLPKVGRINGWLSLEDVQVRARRGGVQVVRTFQVTASAPEPRMLFLPKVDLKFKLGGRELTGQLESVPISVSPLASTEPILRTGFGALRPDRDVPDPDAAGALRNARLLAVALAVLALLWAAVRAFAMRRRGFAPFTLAARKLRRRATGPADPESVRSAYRVLHDAFNLVAGQAVFASQKEKFLSDHPRFAAEANAVRVFFERSEKAFFSTPSPAQGSGAAGGEASGAEIRWLYRFALRLARIEQPGR